MGGLTLAGGIAAALFHREKTGEAKRKSAAKHGTRIIDEAALEQLLRGEPLD